MNIAFEIKVDGNTVTTYTLTPEQIIAIQRCIKRNEARPDGTKPSITEYMIETIGRVGDSWKQLVVEENQRIFAEELASTPNDVSGATSRANARISELNT